MYNGLEKKGCMCMWKLPDGAEFVLKRLHDGGYQAYVMGGCVRDTLLGQSPKDWDVCTNAMPDALRLIYIRFSFYL